MDWIGTFYRSALFPLLMLKQRSRQLAYEREYTCTQFQSAERLEEHQLKRLRALIAHAMHRCDFYRHHLGQAGLSAAQDLRSVGDLQYLPTVPREAVRESWREFIVPDPAGHAMTEKRTSGSTGVPLRVWIDEDAMQHKRALTARHNEWAGHRLGDPVGLVWGDVERPPSLRGRLRSFLLDRVVVLDSQNMDEGRMERFTAAIRHARVRTLIGHAQPLCTYAQYVIQRGIERLPLRAVIPTAMAIGKAGKRLLGTAFGADVFERYGSEETSIIASECAAHRGMHVAAEGLIVEVVAAGQAVEPGEDGHIVVTDLVNYGMPLIRYEIGDTGVLAAEACPCGRGLPTLERVGGRVADGIVTPDGRTVSGISITDHIVEVEGIRQFQIVQESVDELVFRIIRDERFSASSEVALRSHCRRIFGSKMRVRCEFVSSIPPGPGGKYRLCASRLRQQSLTSASSGTVSRPDRG